MTLVLILSSFLLILSALSNRCSAIPVSICDPRLLVNHGMSFGVGNYSTCAYIRDAVSGLFLVMAPDRLLSVQTRLDDTASIIQTLVLNEHIHTTDESETLVVNREGRMLLLVNEDVVFSSPLIAGIYPGIPEDSSSWSIGLSDSKIAVFYNNMVVWDIDTGLHYAASRPVGFTGLDPNEYIQSESSFLLSQLDGRMCIYSGYYPFPSAQIECINKPA